MKTNLILDELILSSGRVISPNEGILGISEKDRNDENRIGEPLIYEGYDNDNSEQFDDSDNPFTDEERKEIAEYVISLWKQWAKL